MPHVEEIKGKQRTILYGSKRGELIKHFQAFTRVIAEKKPVFSPELTTFAPVSPLRPGCCWAAASWAVAADVGRPAAAMAGEM